CTFVRSTRGSGRVRKIAKVISVGVFIPPLYRLFLDASALLAPPRERLRFIDNNVFTLEETSEAVDKADLYSLVDSPPL
ncbi:MAG: hypothetical protein LBO64_09310, partial [Desulfovibrio sp.]|nr:hypothetical protein [Desulfovibrio sp.]